MSRSDWTTPDLSAASARWNQTDSSMNEEPYLLDAFLAAFEPPAPARQEV